MAVVTMTRLHARDAAALEEVLELTGAVLGQLETAAGFLGGRLLLEGDSAWTLSAFADVAAARAFRSAHSPVIAQGPRLADVLQATSWRTGTQDVPTWEQAAQRWSHGGGPRLEQGVSVDVPAGRETVVA